MIATNPKSEIEETLARLTKEEMRTSKSLNQAEAKEIAIRRQFQDCLRRINENLGSNSEEVENWRKIALEWANLFDDTDTIAQAKEQVEIIILSHIPEELNP